MRRRWLTWLLGLATIVVLAVGAFWDHTRPGDAAAKTLRKRYHRQVVNVLDVGPSGSLIVPGPGGQPTPTRLVGIDVDASGVEALRSWTRPEHVWLELPPKRPRGDDGRPRVYAWLWTGSDGTVGPSRPAATSLNERLLMQGLAVANDTAHPESRRYTLLQAQAEHARRGRWSQ